MRRFLRVVVATLLVADIFRPMVMCYLREFGRIPPPAVAVPSGGLTEATADSAAVPYTPPASALPTGVVRGPCCFVEGRPHANTPLVGVP